MVIHLVGLFDVSGVVVSMWKESPLLRDAGADMLTVGTVMAVLDLREEVGNHHFLNQSLQKLWKKW